jgi:hypothetical protein
MRAIGRGKKLTGKYKLKLEPPFRCDFRDPWGNRIRVVDFMMNRDLVLPYRGQKAGVKSAKSGAGPVENISCANSAI